MRRSTGAIALLLLGVLAVPAAGAQEAPDSASGLTPGVRRVAAQRGGSIVQIIRTAETGGRGLRDRFVGSGVSLGGGHILTCAGVVGPAGDVLVVPQGGDTLVAHVLAVDRRSNLAVIETPGLTLPAIPAASGGLLLPGEWVTALGLGAPGTPHATFGTVVVSEGPNLGFSEIDMIQTTVPMFRGYTGGALLNRDGELLGILSGVVELDRDQLEAGEATDLLAGVLHNGKLLTITPSASTLAIPIGPALEIAEQLIAPGYVRRGYLGLQVELGTPGSTPRPGRRRGVLVQNVVSGGPAARAGLLPGDLILDFGDTPVDTAEDLSFLVISRLPGAEVRLYILRRGRPDFRTVRVDQAPPIPWEPDLDATLAAREASLGLPAGPTAR